MPARFDALTPRQRECLRLVFDHHSTKEIAQRLAIGPTTVDGYIAEAVKLLDVRSRKEAARSLAAHEGWIPSKSPPEFSRLDDTTAASASVATPDDQPEWRAWMPIRRHGVRWNELTPAARLIWATAICFAMLIAFGMLLSGLKIMGDLVSAFRRP